MGPINHLCVLSLIIFVSLADELPRWKTMATGPSARYNVAGAAFGSKVLMYGGESNRGDCCQDLWEFDSVLNLWSTQPVNDPNPGQISNCISGDWQGSLWMTGCVVAQSGSLDFKSVWALD